MAFRGDHGGGKKGGGRGQVGTSPPRPDGVPKAAGKQTEEAVQDRALI